jgi:hypothetical protein
VRLDLKTMPMESGRDSTVDESRAFNPDLDLRERYAPGLADGIGDRVLILDDRHTPALELLRFHQTLTTSPGFEVALRRRVERLRHFRHTTFVRTPSVEYLGKDRCLALLSAHTPGRRLSEMLAHAQDPTLAASLIHQLTPALEALGNYSEGVGHGALTADRIVSTPDGQLIIVEHVLGSAVERLHLTTGEIRRDLGIPAPGPDTAYPRADGPTDCFQLALVAVAMLLGRRLKADDYSDLAGALNAALPALDRNSVEAVVGLRAWLERALQLEDGFPSSEEGRAALRLVAVPDPAATAHRWRALRETCDGAVGDRLLMGDAIRKMSSLEHIPTVPQPPAVTDLTSAPVVTSPSLAASSTQHVPVPTGIQTHPSPDRRATFFNGASSYVRWALVAVAICAVLEAFVIAWLLAGRRSPTQTPAVAQVNLLTNDPGAPVMVDGRLAGVTPLDLSISSEMRSIKVGSSLALTPKQDMVVGSTGQTASALESRRERAAADSRTAIAPPAPQRSGGIRVSSPIELEVFEGDRRLGSTATGIVPAAAGRHDFDLINSVVGFRSRQVVDVKAGQVVALSVSPPNGRMNINAVPWAEVLVDGKPVGETPIGNLSLPLGEHEIIFRHPQLGEVRRTAVVRSDAVTRVSANFER